MLTQCYFLAKLYSKTVYCLKMAYFCCFRLGENLDFLQKVLQHRLQVKVLGFKFDFFISFVWQSNSLVLWQNLHKNLLLRTFGKAVICVITKGTLPHCC